MSDELRKGPVCVTRPLQALGLRREMERMMREREIAEAALSHAWLNVGNIRQCLDIVLERGDLDEESRSLIRHCRIMLEDVEQ